MPTSTTETLKEGRYNIEQEPESDGAVTRFQAFDLVEARPVTIVSFPSPGGAEGENFQNYLEKFAGPIRAFRHKQAIAVREQFNDGGSHFIVSDRSAGVSARSFISDLKCAPIGDIVNIAEAVLNVLQSIHTMRPPAVFRRLSPDSIVMRPDGGVYLDIAAMVFGTAAVSGAGKAAQEIAYSPLEQIIAELDAASQKVILDRYDEAAERILRMDLDARSDIYSLGATLYHLATGVRPHDALERSIEMMEGGPDPLRSPNQMDASFPVELSDVVMKAMEIRREYRFDSAAIMLQVMRTAVTRIKERGVQLAAGPPPQPAAEPLLGLNAYSDVAGGSTPAAQYINQPLAELTRTTRVPVGAPVRSVEPDPLADDVLDLPEDDASVEQVISPRSSNEILEAEGPSLPLTVSEDNAAEPDQTDDAIDPLITSTPEKVETDTQNEERETEATLLFSEAPKTGISRAAAAGMGLALVAAAGIGGWLYIDRAASGNPAPLPPAAAVETISPEAPGASQSTALSSVPAEAPAETTLPNELPADNAEPQVADAAPKRARPAGPAAPRTQRPVADARPVKKKAVTVDDLINDN
jgi:serine/threonine protein kinase